MIEHGPGKSQSSPSPINGEDRDRGGDTEAAGHKSAAYSLQYARISAKELSQVHEDC